MPQVGNSQVGYILVEVIPGVKKKTVIINSMAYASVISSSAHRPPPLLGPTPGIRIFWKQNGNAPNGDKQAVQMPRGTGKKNKSTS